MRYLFLGIILALVLGLLFVCIDAVFFEGTKVKDIQYESACDFKVPKEWKIVSNGKYYAVKKVSDGEKEYLSDGRFYIRCYYASIAYPTLLSSECKAKGYLKAYLYQNRDRSEELNFK